MPHSLAPHRDAINALIGPLEEVQDNLETLIANVKDAGWSASANFLHYIRIDEAISDLSSMIAEIDGWEDEPAEPEADEEAEDDDQDDDSDEDEDEDEE